MKLIVKQTVALNGRAMMPGSKSHSIRALMMATLCQGESQLTNVVESDDMQDAIAACKKLGVSIHQSQNSVTVVSQGLPYNPDSHDINVGNSGVTTHFMLPLLGLRKNPDQPIVLNCHDQMRARPIKSFIDTLQSLGLHITYLEDENKLPLQITGKLMGGEAYVDGITSQYLSALLFALPCAEKDSAIKVMNLKERPYVDMTLKWLEMQKIEIRHSFTQNCDTYHIKGRQNYKKFNAVIPGDFSSASCLIVASVLMRGEIDILGLDMTDAQGDKQLISILQKMGADIVVSSECIQISGGKKLSGIRIDAGDIPDLLPALAVIGTYASGKTEIYNAAHARIKETDRIMSMAAGLRLMDAKIIENEDGLTIFQSQLKGAFVESYGDHRTAMALSVAAMLATGETVIEGSEAMNKTFPHFVEIMKTLGANMEEEYELFF